MNEIYAPLYYVFKTNEHGEYGEMGGFGSADHAEADAFFCFVDLMGEFRDNFCKQLVIHPDVSSPDRSLPSTGQQHQRSACSNLQIFKVAVQSGSESVESSEVQDTGPTLMTHTVVTRI